MIFQESSQQLHSSNKKLFYFGISSINSSPLDLHGRKAFDSKVTRTMKSSVFLKWVFFSLVIFIILQQNHAKMESNTEPFGSNQFLNRVFRWKKKRELEAEEQGLSLEFRTILAGVLSFVGASISSAGGVGGGGLFVPILNLVAGLDVKTATAISAFMVTGGSLANAIYCFSIRNSKFGHKPLVDFDIALLSEPCMLLGVGLGVICNVMCPEWLITILLAIFLACSTLTTCRAGFKRWRTETHISGAQKVEREDKEHGFSGSESVRSSSLDEGVVERMKTPLLDEKREVGFGFPWKKMVILVMIWVSFFALHVLRGDQSKQSLIQIEPCGVGYWLLSAFQFPLALVFTAWILTRKECPEHYNPDQILGEEKGGRPKLVFPLVALLAGILGGLFGIGGGMLINPVLLQIGVPPQIAAATSSFMVLFSSSMTAVQYLLLGMKHLDYALVFAAICFSSSLIGLVLIQRAIERYGRASLIVFSVGTVTAISAILVCSFGALNVCRGYINGQYMGFRLPC